VVAGVDERGEFRGFNVDLGVENEFQGMGINLRASAEFFRLAIKVMQKGMPGKLECGLTPKNWT
jgi:hypothetical protein